MAWILLFIGTIIVVECFIRSPLSRLALGLVDLLKKIMGVLRSSSISDHWKEKVLPVYAGRLFLNSISLFFWVVLALLPLVVIAWLASMIEVPLYSLLSSLTGVAVSTLIAIGYVFLTRRVRKI